MKALIKLKLKILAVLAGLGLIMLVAALGAAAFAITFIIEFCKLAFA